jgi:hypothetical protein
MNNFRLLLFIITGKGDNIEKLLVIIIIYNNR